MAYLVFSSCLRVFSFMLPLLTPSTLYCLLCSSSSNILLSHYISDSLIFREGEGERSGAEELGRRERSWQGEQMWTANLLFYSSPLLSLHSALP